LLRGATVIDATGLNLLLLWALGSAAGAGEWTFLAAAKIYCVLAAVGLAGMTTVCLVRGRVARVIAALVAGAALLAALASPLWVNAFVGPGRDLSDQQAAVDWAVRINPFFAVAGELHGFTWQTHGAMYRLTRIGGYIPPRPIAWCETAGLYLALAAATAAASAGGRRILGKTWT
jgi:hypothetical protein